MTIKKSTTDIDRRLLMDRSVPGRKAFALPQSDVPVQEWPDYVQMRDDLELPEVSQLEVIRYFSILSQRNFSIDTNFYQIAKESPK